MIETTTTTQGVATITINRPQRRNALSWEAMEAFSAAIEQAERTTDLRVLIVTGTDGAFCAGGDLQELNDYPTYEDGSRLATIMGEALDHLARLPVPTIAAINGPALGGGAELALACDLRVMEDTAIMGCMHLRLGIVPAWGGGQYLMRIVGYPLAFEWLTTGRVLRAAEAFENGLANRVVAEGESLEEAHRLAEDICAYDADAVRAIKQLLRDGLELPPDEALLAERRHFAGLWAAPAHLQAQSTFMERRNHRSR